MDARGGVAVVAEDVQVAAKARRRTYTAEYKRRILKEADACMATLLQVFRYVPPRGARAPDSALKRTEQCQRLLVF